MITSAKDIMWQPLFRMISAALHTAPLVLHHVETFPVAFSNYNREPEGYFASPSSSI